MFSSSSALHHELLQSTKPVLANQHNQFCEVESCGAAHQVEKMLFCSAGEKTKSTFFGFKMHHSAGEFCKN